MPRYTFYPSQDDVQLFKEQLELNMATLAAFHQLLQDQEGDPQFAESLVSYYNKYDRLSEKQMWQAARMCMELNAAGHVKGEGLPFTTKNSQGFDHDIETADIPRVVIDNDKALALINKFDRAAEDMKYPSVTLPLDKNESIADLEKIKFYRTGPKSKHPDSVNVTNGKNGEEFLLLGTILRTGVIAWGSFVFGKPELQQLVKKLTENLMEEAVVRGKKWSSCCFCGLTLENKISIFHGYGPICAGKYNLPWESENVYELKDPIVELGMPEENA